MNSQKILMPRLSNEWLSLIGGEFEKPYYQKLKQFLDKEYNSNTIYPEADDIFNAFQYTPLHSLKVVILGQDPYHNDNQAHGLCFSVKPEQKKIPPSLVNIYKELALDLACTIPNNGHLKHWADQGVLLLNTVLTVKAHSANSHQKQGWEIFTDNVIQALDTLDRPIVYLLWGKPAQTKQAMLTNKNHLILQAPHPSPLSAHRGFFGSKHFSKTNTFLEKHALSPIDWQIPHI